MFCTKTSVGYFNYRQYVQLFPPPSYIQLTKMLIVSFFVAIICTALAAGFNSNPANKITQIQGGKICWFTLNVIHYFLTIPICLFLLINIIVIIMVAKHSITYAREAESKSSAIIRRRRCLIIILSSCITQGVGWIFGPFMLLVNPSAADVLGWFFIIFNGLEGVWAIILYILVRKEGMDENVRNKDQHRLDYIINNDAVQPHPDDEDRDRQYEGDGNDRHDSPRQSFNDLADLKTDTLSYQDNDDDR
jgi:hypothetical protein